MYICPRKTLYSWYLTPLWFNKFCKCIFIIFHCFSYWICFQQGRSKIYVEKIKCFIMTPFSETLSISILLVEVETIENLKRFFNWIKESSFKIWKQFGCMLVRIVALDLTVAACLQSLRASVDKWKGHHRTVQRLDETVQNNRLFHFYLYINVAFIH